MKSIGSKLIGSFLLTSTSKKVICLTLLLGMVIFFGCYDSSAASLVDCKEVLPESLPNFPVENEPSAYRSKVTTYPVVSELNCQKTPDGNLSSCLYPTIELKNEWGTFPAVPFETVVKVKVSRACRLSQPFSTLQIRLGKPFAASPADDSAAARYNNSDFLGFQDLNIDHNRKITLTQTNHAPLGSLKISPLAPKIFLDSLFPRGCEIFLTLEMNRIALRTQQEARQHLTQLSTQAQLMAATLKGLQALPQEMPSLAQNLLALFQRNQENLSNFQLKWEPLRKLLPELNRQLEHEKENIFSLRELTLVINTFTDFLDGILGLKDVSTGADLEDSIKKLMPGTPNPLQRFVDLLDKEYLTQLEKRVQEAQHQVRVAQQALDSNFSDKQVVSRLLEELRDQLILQISGPHGMIDQFVHGLYQNGKKRHANLVGATIIGVQNHA